MSLNELRMLVYWIHFNKLSKMTTRIVSYVSLFIECVDQSSSTLKLGPSDGGPGDEELWYDMMETL